MYDNRSFGQYIATELSSSVLSSLDLNIVLAPVSRIELCHINFSIATAIAQCVLAILAKLHTLVLLCQSSSLAQGQVH